MKNTKLLIITLIFPLIFINCSNQYDGGAYTGSSMSSKKITEKNDQEALVTEEKLMSETVSTQSIDEVIENENNYK
tara:strand:- start:525 stop:752 length:228 start_codon:yes stop_codon:yes gene_type:complete